MTLKEATENGVDYWEFFVLHEGKQIRVAGGMVKRCWYHETLDTVSIDRLSAPAKLEPVRKGNGWYQFALGDGLLTVWPIEAEQ